MNERRPVVVRVVDRPVRVSMDDLMDMNADELMDLLSDEAIGFCGLEELEFRTAPTQSQGGAVVFLVSGYVDVEAEDLSEMQIEVMRLHVGLDYSRLEYEVETDNELTTEEVIE